MGDDATLHLKHRWHLLELAAEPLKKLLVNALRSVLRNWKVALRRVLQAIGVADDLNSIERRLLPTSR
jgi:hypothetical protein